MQLRLNSTARIAIVNLGTTGAALRFVAAAFDN
jgi:hypothetical protein